MDLVQVSSCSWRMVSVCLFFFFQAEDGIRDLTVTGVQTCALPIWVLAGAPEQLGLHADRRERVVDLVRHAARDLAHGGELLAGDQLALGAQLVEIGRASCRERV